MWKSSKTTVTGPSGKKKNKRFPSMSICICIWYLTSPERRFPTLRPTEPDKSLIFLRSFLGVLAIVRSSWSLWQYTSNLAVKSWGTLLLKRKNPWQWTTVVWSINLILLAVISFQVLSLCVFAFFNIFWTVKSMLVSFILKVQTFVFATDSKLHLKIRSKYISKLGFINESNGHV